MDIHFKLDGIEAVADALWSLSKNAKVFAFHGAMGAGKTTFIHALCEKLKVEQPVSSPTYAIINEYGSGTGRIFHIDLYRLKDEEEALMAGVEECLYSGETCFVEWPERAPGLFPDETVHVFLDAVSEDTRRIRISGN